MADLASDDDVILISEATAPAADVAAEEVALIDEAVDGASLPKHAKPQADGSVVLPLRFPVVMRYRTSANDAVREERIEELVLHRLNGADMRAIQAASGDSQAAVALGRSARVPQMKFGATYDRMDASDIDAASRVLMHFLGNGRPTGR